MHPRRKTVQFGRRCAHVQKRLTDELLDQIVHSDTPDAFLAFGDGIERDLAAYLSQMLAAKGKSKSEVIRSANLNETFGYQIFSGKRHPRRDNALALGFGLGLDLREMRRLLAHADVGDLYSKNRRDAIIIFCISHGYDLMRTDEELYRYGEETISDDGNAK